MIERKDIEKLGTLSRLSLSDEEKEAFASEIDAILGYVSRIRSVEAGSAQSVSNVSDVFREDGAPHESGLYTEAILASAPRREGDYIKVKKILPS